MVQLAKVFQLLLAALLLVPAASEDLSEGLAKDDECSAGEEGCGLNALQLRGAAVDEEELEVQELGDNDTDADLSSAPDGYLAMKCRNRGYCVMGGYLVVAGRPDAIGMESINAGDAGYYNSMMSAADRYCGGPSCVLITNPMHHRTQSRFHIHFRHYNGHGAALKSRMEKAVCGKSGWHKGGFPCGGKAAYFSHFPGVFSASMGAGSLAHAAVSVWPSSCHGGTIILVSFHCSIEHSISNR